jgi:IS5 family transposase
VRLAEALDDRASFRRFCGFAANEPTRSGRPSSAFRAELSNASSIGLLFDAVTGSSALAAWWFAPAHW